jgi:hypothetical protein
MLHQKMQKLQRRLFYAPLSSEDNVVIENSKLQGQRHITSKWILNQNCQSHLGLLAASQRPHNYHLRLIQHIKPHASCCISSSRRCTQKESEISTSDHGQCN